jgi:DNA-binding response OmpR family regulator
VLELPALRAYNRRAVAHARVLVVDDDRALRRSLERVLRLADYEVTLADGGRAALEAQSAEQHSLVVLDVGMPPPDGIEVLRRMGCESETRQSALWGTSAKKVGNRR